MKNFEIVVFVLFDRLQFWVWSLKPAIQEELLLMRLGKFNLFLRELLELLLNLFKFLVVPDFCVKKTKRLHKMFVLFFYFRNGIIRCSTQRSWD